MNIFNALRQRRQRARTLDSLRRLDDHMLRDIGFERDQLGLFDRNSARLQDLGR
jgi:uncharacterized protein YjiS (DUF1127 family)